MNSDFNSSCGAALKAVEKSSSDWLYAIRKEGFNRFLSLGIPVGRDEDWKYTRLSELEKTAFSLSMPHAMDITSFAIHSLKLLDSHVLVFVDGYYQPNLSNITGLEDSVILMNIKESVDKYGDLLKSILSNQYPAAFAELNTALLTDGLFLHVPNDVTLNKPIHFLHLSTQKDHNAMSHVRNLFLIGENSNVSLLEEYACLEDKESFKGGNFHESPREFRTIFTQIEVSANSRVNYFKVQRESKRAFHIANTQINQCASSYVYTWHFGFGARIAREDIHINFKEKGASCQLYGLYCLNKGQHMDYHTRVDHQVPCCTSHQLYKGIIAGKASSVFNGKIFVHENAKQTDAHQINKNLLLSEAGEVNTKPELEIYNDDVKCTHGATVGQLDKETLFYLRSRGINERAAKNILLHAFREEVVNSICIDSIRDHVAVILHDVEMLQ